MINKNLKVRFSPEPWSCAYGVHIFVSDGQTFSRAENIVFQEAPYGDAVHHGPVLQLDETQARVLMEDLWGAGIRPSEWKNGGETVKALQNHLEDMRRLVFKPEERKAPPSP